MRDKVVYVKAIWDKEAQVWVAISEDVPGLATEADTLVGNNDSEVSFHLLSERTEVAKLGT